MSELPPLPLMRFALTCRSGDPGLSGLSTTKPSGTQLGCAQPQQQKPRPQRAGCRRCLRIKFPVYAGSQEGLPRTEASAFPHQPVALQPHGPRRGSASGAGCSAELPLPAAIPRERTDGSPEGKVQNVLGSPTGKKSISALIKASILSDPELLMRFKNEAWQVANRCAQKQRANRAQACAEGRALHNLPSAASLSPHNAGARGPKQHREGNQQNQQGCLGMAPSPCRTGQERGAAWCSTALTSAGKKTLLELQSLAMNLCERGKKSTKTLGSTAENKHPPQQ